MSGLPDVARAVYGVLAADPGVSALAGERIYNLLAPSGVPRPYIIFYLASGILDRRTPRLDGNDVYRVEAVADSRQAADTLHRAIWAALDGAALSIDGYSNFWTAGERLTVLTETREGRQVWRYITDYRIRTSRRE